MTLQYLTPAQAENTLGALYVEETGPTLSFLVGLLSQPHYRAWSLVAEGLALGAIWYQCVEQHAELLDLRVSRGLRRSGYGSTLLKETLCLIGQDDVRTVDLEVRASNVSARSLYGKMGFELTGRRHNYYSLPTGEREDAMLMSLTLQVTEKLE
jgi:ribosomal-protein-alanine N-acetyltransferase